MFLAAQTSYNNCNFSSHSPRHKRLFHGNAYEKAAEAYQIENVIVFTEAIFGKKDLVFGSAGGVGVKARGGSGRTSCQCVCAAALCASPPVFMGHLKASKCAAVCGLRVLLQASGRAASAGLQLK